MKTYAKAVVPVKVPVKVLVPLIDNGVLYLPGEIVELDEMLVDRGVNDGIYERVNKEPKATSEEPEMVSKKPEVGQEGVKNDG